MPRLHTKAELATVAQLFALQFDLIDYQGQLFMPVDFETYAHQPTDPARTVWIPLSERKLRAVANALNILFQSPQEERSFKHMTMQFARHIEQTSFGVLMRTGDTISELTTEGQLVPVTAARFIPNYISIPYVKNNPKTPEMWGYLTEWLGSESQAHSLLYHLATIFQPSWSAVKYVLLLGSGRNGKSTLLLMLQDILGRANYSKVKRQMMSEQSPLMLDLNNKLANIVLDGMKEFLKDSSTEKTLVAGEDLDIEIKYENAPYTVQTNALFIEGLQTEPRVSDKSVALQKRLVRFYFPNEYPLNKKFEDYMRQPEMLAALVELMLQHWVTKDTLEEKLAITAESMDLQMNAVWTNSPIIRFLEWMSGREMNFLEDIVNKKMMVDVFLLSYRSWCDNNGYKNIEDDYLLQVIGEHFTIGKKTFRINGKPTSRKYLEKVGSDTLNSIQALLRGESIVAETEDETILAE
jgi:phage/plasmid-associated DNA primase